MLRKRLFATSIATIATATLMMVSISPISAQEKGHITSSGRIVNSTTSSIKPRFANDFRHRKVNVRTYNEWSPYKRVSDNIQTGPSGGSITANKSVEFNVSVSGSATGINISITSEIGYTLNVGPNRRVYMGYRVLYKVETGTDELYDIATGRVISSSKYTVKTPQHGEYGLVNY